MMPVTKVVILNWNGRAHMEHFLPSVVATAPGGVGVVVADNGSTDGSPEWLAGAFPGVEVVPLDRNYGYAGGYNRALDLIEADYFVLLNSDVETSAGWCEPLVAMLDADPAVAAVMPKMLSYSDKAKFEYAGAAGGFIDSLGYPFCRGRILSTTEHDTGQYDDAREVFWASGACMIVRASAWREAGGFDDAFFAHMEEIDLCWRMQLLGHRIMVEPASRVWHLGGGTLAAGNEKKIYLNFRNSLAMLFRNLPPHRAGRVIATRMMLDALSAAIYLVQGRPRLFRAVVRAHRDFRRWRPALRASRMNIHPRNLKTIYKGSILLRYLFGRRTFGDMM